MDLYQYWFGSDPDYFFKRLMDCLYEMNNMCKNELIDSIKNILSYKFDINKFDKNSYTPLMYLLSSPHLHDDLKVSIVKILLDAGADLNLKNSYNDCALSFALGDPWNLKTIEFLLKNGAKAKGIVNGTMAQTYNNADRIQMIKLLVKYGWDIEDKDNLGHTLLWHAISRKNRDLSIELINMGAYVNSINNNGQSLLMYFTNVDTILFLIEHGADPSYVNPRGSVSTLMCWINKNNKDLNVLIKDFLDKGIFKNVNLMNSSGDTALTCAIRCSDSIGILSLLAGTLENANGKLLDRIHDNLLQRMSVYHTNKSYCRCEIFVEIVQMLWQKGLDLGNSKYNFLMKTIKYSLYDHYYSIVEILLKETFCAQRCVEPYTYLTAAIRKNNANYKIIHLLLNHGADPFSLTFKKSKKGSILRKKSFVAYLNFQDDSHKNIWLLMKKIIVHKNNFEAILSTIPLVSAQFTSGPGSIAYKLT